MSDPLAAVSTDAAINPAPRKHAWLLVRWGAFILRTHPPARYLLLTTLWCASLLALLTHSEQSLRILPTDVWAVLSFYLILMYLRAVDEIKDLEYDRVHKPDRPLVRGDLSVRDVALLAATIAAVVAICNWSLQVQYGVFVVVNLAYGVFLLWLERASRTFRESPLLNLVITFPVSAALNVYVWQHLLATDRAAFDVGVLLAIAAHMAAFLHFEFGRKLKWPNLVRDGDNGYAQVLGMRGAIAACIVLGGIACGLAMGVHLRAGAAPWLASIMCLALVPSGFALRRLLRQRSQAIDLQPLFTLFLPIFFLANISIAALTHS
jgi:4-hydroxybenzoate polyprenyltransferase